LVVVVVVIDDDDDDDDDDDKGTGIIFGRGIGTESTTSRAPVLLPNRTVLVVYVIRCGTTWCDITWWSR
jgi:hypothetical protein